MKLRNGSGLVRYLMSEDLYVFFFCENVNRINLDQKYSFNLIFIIRNIETSARYSYCRGRSQIIYVGNKFITEQFSLLSYRSCFKKAHLQLRHD